MGDKLFRLKQTNDRVWWSDKRSPHLSLSTHLLSLTDGQRWNEAILAITTLGPTPNKNETLQLPPFHQPQWWDWVVCTDIAWSGALAFASCCLRARCTLYRCFSLLLYSFVRYKLYECILSPTERCAAWKRRECYWQAELFVSVIYCTTTPFSKDQYTRLYSQLSSLHCLMFSDYLYVLRRRATPFKRSSSSMTLWEPGLEPAERSAEAILEGKRRGLTHLQLWEW